MNGSLCARKEVSCGITSYDNNPLDYPKKLEVFKGMADGQVRLEQYLVGEWTNAYAIERWMKENGDQENPEEYTVDRERITELRNLCMDILANPGTAPVKLPTFLDEAGEYDKWYFEKLRYTVNLMNAALKMLEGLDDDEIDDWRFIYMSDV